MKVGDKVLVDMFEGESFVDIAGTSKGRGFAGVVKRHKFAGGAASHGSMFQITGSIGSSSFPSRVFKGMRMSGHMGVDRKLRSATCGCWASTKTRTCWWSKARYRDTKDGYVLITKAKKPPRERRGFSGTGTVDPLKASKRAVAKKK